MTTVRISKCGHKLICRRWLMSLVTTPSSDTRRYAATWTFEYQGQVVQIKQHFPRSQFLSITQILAMQSYLQYRRIRALARESAISLGQVSNSEESWCRASQVRHLWGVSRKNKISHKDPGEWPSAHDQPQQRRLDSTNTGEERQPSANHRHVRWPRRSIESSELAGTYA